MNRQLFAFLTLLAVLVLGIIMLASWMLRVEDHLEGLGTSVERLSARLDDAEARAAAAEARADAAEETAGEAQIQAGLAEEQAALAEEEAEIADQARTAAIDERLQAELEAEDALAEAEAAREREAAAMAEATMAYEAATAAERDAEEARAEAADLRAQRERELARLEGALGELAETRRTALGLVMNLGNSVEFDFNKADLRPENRELLSRIAGVLMTAGDYHIQVFGHTDDVGSATYNQQLSERRAQSVVDYLVDAGVQAKVISARGLGKSQPLVEGTDETARQRNRRVEIAVISYDSSYQAVDPAREPSDPPP